MERKEEIKTENPLDKKMTEGICCVSRNSRARLLRCGLVLFYKEIPKELPMKQKALRAGDAHSHEDEECRKRLRSARECAEAHSFL